MTRLYILLLALFLSAKTCFAQPGISYGLGFYYGIGSALPVNSFSKGSPSYNAFGKKAAGLNIRGGLEYFINEKHVLSLDADYAVFQNITNDSLNNIIKHRVLSYGAKYTGVNSDADMTVSHICAGYSRIFYSGDFIFQPKICAGIVEFGYDYAAAYIDVAPSTVQPGQIPLTSQVVYTFKDQYYFTIKPELNIKYCFSEGKHAVWMVGVGAGYFYSGPRIALYEQRTDAYTKVTTLHDNIHCITVNANISVVLSPEFFRRVRNFIALPF